MAANAGAGVDPLIYTFSVDGVPRAPSSSDTLTTSFTTAGQHLVEVATTCTGYTDSGSLTVKVNEAFTGSIAVSPDPPYTNETATLTATQTGGLGPDYAYAWDTDDDGAFDDGTTRTVTPTFTTDGPQVVRVRIRDSATPVHEIVVTRTLNLGPRPADVPRPPPAPCVKKLTFGLSEFTTEGCFTNTSSKRWETTAAVKLNGISFPDFGQTFVITEPTAAQPGGHFTATRSAIQLGSSDRVLGRHRLGPALRRAGGGEALALRRGPAVAKLFSLKVLGSTEIRLGWGADGKHYAMFPLNIQFPNVFTPAPTSGSGTITGSTSVRVDERGPNFDGLKISAANAYIGRIKVPEVCFSYVPAGGRNVAPCAAPSLDGKPYLTCNNSATTDRWDGNGILELPVADQVRYSVFGGLADGRLSSLGGFADNIGALGVQLAPGVDLDRFGAGVCLDPPPFKVRGDVGVGLLKGKLRVNGRFIYTDPFEGRPWSIEAGGNATIADTSLGDGSLTFNAWGDVDFGLSADINLNVATLKGQAAGWVEPRNDLFNVTGTLKGLPRERDLRGRLRAGLEHRRGGLRRRRRDQDRGARQPPHGAVRLRLDLVQHPHGRLPLKAGFGHRFGAGVDLLGNSCDFSAYSATRSGSAQAAAGGTLSERIAPGTKAVSLRIRGSKGAPKVIVRGPDGTTITSPGKQRGKQRKGRYLLAENKKAKTTSVLLVKPAAGTWTVKAAPGTTSRPTRIDRSNFEAPPALFGQVRWTAPYHREVAFAYAVPTGAKVSLVERSRKGIGRTLVRSVRGKPCRGARPLPGGRKLLCVRKKFRVARGPGGDRTIQAVVTRGGIPLARRNVAKFRAPRQPVPARPGALTVRRTGGGLVVVFPRSRGASRYSVTAVLADGRRLGFDLAGSCRAVRIPKVAGGVGAAVKVAGVRYDVKPGPTAASGWRADATRRDPPGDCPRRSVAEQPQERSPPRGRSGRSARPAASRARTRSPRGPGRRRGRGRAATRHGRRGTSSWLLARRSR